MRDSEVWRVKELHLIHHFDLLQRVRGVIADWTYATTANGSIKPGASDMASAGVLHASGNSFYPLLAR